MCFTGFPVRALGLSCDNWNFNASNPCLYGGGNYNQNLNHGLFYVSGNGVSNANANHGSRISDNVKISCIIGTGFRAPLGEDRQVWERVSTSEKDVGKPVLST